MTTLPKRDSNLKWFDLNTQAISLIRDGRFNEADEILGEALNQLEDSLPGDDDSDCEVTESHKVKGASYNRPRDIYIIDANSPLAVKSEEQLRSFFLYDKLFLAAEKPWDGSASDTTFSYCLVLYNMGLSMHIWALKSGQDSRLTTALHYYQTAIGLLEEEEAYVGATIRALLELALSNNCAHIHSVVFDVESLNHYALGMANALRAGSLADNLDCATRSFFLSNVKNSPYLGTRHAAQA